MHSSTTLNSLTADQRAALLARIQGQTLSERRIEADSFPQVEPMGETRFEPFALTDIQQAYWVGRQQAFALGNISAHGYMEVDCPDLDLPRLERCLNALVRRHDMLRAIVHPDGRQQILRTVPDYRIRCHELADEPEEVRAGTLREVREEMSHQVLDAAVWPLFDIRASRLGNGLTRLHLSLDVLIFDAQSFDLMSEELRQLYTDETAELPPLRLSYADYVAGLAKLKDTALYQRSQDYWRHKLRSLPPAPDLPLARFPDSIGKPQFVRRSGRLEAAAWDRIKRRAQKLGVTPSAVMLTLYLTVLGRWSASKRFTLNLTLFNRLPFHPEVGDLVGDFTSVILLAADLTRPATLAERVRQVQEQLLEDMDHRFVSGVWVMRELMEQRRDAAAQLMPVVFTSTLQPTAGAAPPAAMSWLGEVSYTITQTPQVWLDNQIGEDAGALVYDWDAVDGLFHPGMLDDMFAAFGGMLNRLACDEAAWLAAGDDILPPGQKQIIEAANRTAGPVPRGLLHQGVLEQCERTPQRPAVLGDGYALTFGELRRDANALAHRLWRADVETGELVAVLLPKGGQQIVAVLGILEAGAAYVPIEVSYSDERVARLMALAGISCVVTAGSVLVGRQLPVGTRIIDIDTLAPDHTPVPLPVMQRPTDTAYVIYTSGSTGTPKGVVIDHRGALNTCVDINERFAVGPDDRVLALSALNFDLSVWDIFGVLAAGGALVIPSPAHQQEPAHWAALMETHGVTLWNTVPALLDIYVSYLRDVAGRRDERLRLAMMSGDWIPLQLPDAIRTWCPTARQISLGGATEASIWSIWYPIDTIDPDWRSIPYGKALRNQTFHVLNEQLEVCPFWVPGELFIGGIGVAKGYWNDPERTAAAFITHPRTGERLYRTGDLGRYLPDGNIEFLGRKDFQVKVNGYRVELGEIEASLIAFPGIRSAVVALHGGQGEAKQLVAYYVAEQDPAGDEAAKLKFRLSQPGIRRFAPDRPVIALPDGGRLTEGALGARRSHRAWDERPVTREQLARLLDVLRQGTRQGLPKYLYGSAGSLYPVQAYLHVRAGRVEGVPAGLYYYHPVQHTLVTLTEGELFDGGWMPEANRAMVDSAAFQLFLVGDLDAIEPFYGDSAPQLCLLEAGMICQLLEMEMAATGLGLCQTGGFDFDRARPHFQLDRRHLYLHGLAGGVALAADAVVEPAAAPLGLQPFEDRLRAHLQKKLPAYMVPAVFVRMDDLPLSANGKVDRKALPAPQPRRAETAPFRAPDSELAKLICATWAEVLGRGKVGINDNFFDLGGTSVDMIKIHTRLQPKLPQPVTLVDMFFTHPTIEALLQSLGSPQGPAPAAAGGRDADRSAGTGGLAAQRTRRSGARRGQSAPD